MRKSVAALLTALALVSCGKGAEQQKAKAPAKQAPATAAGQGGVTPMAQRVAVLGILNKRNGITRDVSLRPGQSARWKDLIVELRACEATAPWEEEKLTGAVVRVFVQQTNRGWNGKRAGHDRGVRRAAAEIGGDPEDAIPIHGSGIGRSEIVRDKNVRFARQRHHLRRFALQISNDTAHYVLNVESAFAQIRIVDLT